MEQRPAGVKALFSRSSHLSFLSSSFVAFVLLRGRTRGRTNPLDFDQAIQGRFARRQSSSGAAHPGRLPTPAGPGRAGSPLRGGCLGGLDPARCAGSAAPWPIPHFRPCGYAVFLPHLGLRPPHRAPSGGARGSSSTGDRAPVSGGAARSARPSRPGKRARQQFRPRAVSAGRPRSGGLGARCGRLLRGRHRRDFGPPRAGRREHARVAHGVEAWRRHAGGQAAQQRQRVHVHRDRPVGVRLLQGDAHQAVGAWLEALLGDLWASDAHSGLS